VNSKRLLKLAKFLETKVPKGRFNYDIVFSNYSVKLKGGPECGTAACAMGWACSIPEFRKLGLKPAKELPIFQLRWKGRDESFNYVATKLFGISYQDADNLFTSDLCYTNREEPTDDPHYVAHKIRDYVAAMS
jgi:hypothetical protein